MAQDNNLGDIFDTAALKALENRKSTLSPIVQQRLQERLEARKPTVEKILSEIAFKYDNNVFTLRTEKMATTSRLFVDTIDGQSLQVAEDGLGNFRIYRDGQKTSNSSTIEEAVAAIGKFFGEYCEGVPPKAPRFENYTPAPVAPKPQPLYPWPSNTHR